MTDPRITRTADLLVNQLRTGSLDAVIVYEANVAGIKDKIDYLPIEHRAALAVQPFGIGTQTKHPQLMLRLLKKIRSSQSRQRFEQAGFRWLARQE